MNIKYAILLDSNIILGYHSDKNQLAQAVWELREADVYELSIAKMSNGEEISHDYTEFDLSRSKDGDYEIELKS